jgi:hypothetical protein
MTKPSLETLDKARELADFLEAERNAGSDMDLTLNRRRGDGADTYIGYSVFADQADTGLDPASLLGQPNKASLIAGSRHRVSDQMSVFGENRFAIGGQAPAIARVYGLAFDPAEYVSVTASLEQGRIDDAQAGLMRRTAASMGIGFSGQDFPYWLEHPQNSSQESCRAYPAR